MKKLIYLFIISALTTACGGADSDNSRLNGKWISSQCLSINLDFTSDEYLSLKQVMELKNGAITYTLHQYTDTECNNFGREIPDGLTFHIEDSYTLPGSEISNDNGTAGFIDFVSQAGDTLPDIYLLTDSGKTLYFGLKAPESMVPCSDDQPEPVPVYHCWETRPTEFNYNFSYSKLDG